MTPTDPASTWRAGRAGHGRERRSKPALTPAETAASAPRPEAPARVSLVWMFEQPAALSAGVDEGHYLEEDR